MSAGGQLALPFQHSPTYGPDFFTSDSNAEAQAWLGRGEWPQGRLALWGAPGRGKTHLLHLWATKTGAAILRGEALTLVPAAGPLAIDEAQSAPAIPLLHTLNAAAEAGHPLLLASRDAPARWHVSLPDLASRLKAITAVEIREPDEALLRALLARLFADRQMVVPEPVQDFLLLHLPRTASALREAAARLDRAALLAGRAPGRTLARGVVEEMAGGDAA